MQKDKILIKEMETIIEREGRNGKNILTSMLSAAAKAGCENIALLIAESFLRTEEYDIRTEGKTLLICVIDSIEWLPWGERKELSEKMRTIIGILAKRQLEIADGMGTPLHHAARKGSLACVKLLLSLGANPFVKDRFGNSSLLDAARWDDRSGRGHDPDIVSVLKEAMGKDTERDTKK